LTGGALETTSSRGDRVSIGQQDRATEGAARLGGVFRPPWRQVERMAETGSVDSRSFSKRSG
jgi:hypothetical protein